MTPTDGPAQVTDKTWEILREEGAVIEEALEGDGDSLEENVDEKALPSIDAVMSTFNEKSDGLHEYPTDDVVDIHPNKQSSDNEDGKELL